MQHSKENQQPKNFFLRNMGPSLEVLSFTSHSKAQKLLNTISKTSRTFYQKNKQGILQTSHPSVMSASMSPLEPITNVLPQPICRIIHLREMIFLVGYSCGIIEMRDLAKSQMTGGQPDEPLLTFNAAESENVEAFNHERG